MFLSECICVETICYYIMNLAKIQEVIISFEKEIQKAVFSDSLNAALRNDYEWVVTTFAITGIFPTK